MEGVFYVRGNLHGVVSYEGGGISWRMSEIYQHYLKNNHKLNKFSLFFTESKE